MMTKEQLVKRIELEMDAYSGNGGYNLSLMYNERFMFLGQLLRLLLDINSNVINVWGEDIITCNKKYYKVKTLDPITDEETICLLNMIIN